MTYHKYRKLFITTLFCCAVFGGCSNIKINDSNALIKASAANYLKKNSELEEYVAKVSKRILMVSDAPSLNCKFIITNENKKIIEINKSGIITISRKTLETLKDEAQLAAIISYIMVQFKPEYKNKTSFFSESEAISYDKLSMVCLARAGYNPMAAIELQEIYHGKGIRHSNWLNNVFLKYNISAARINTNKRTLENLPKSAERSEQNYQKNLGLQE